LSSRQKAKTRQPKRSAARSNISSQMSRSVSSAQIRRPSIPRDITWCTAPSNSSLSGLAMA
jgi:hypothetical protein